MDPSVAPSVREYPDLEHAARALAGRVVELARTSLSERGRCAIVLSGGSTPQVLFQALATEFRGVLPWDRVDYFWADERMVAPDDPRSNFGLAERSWIGTLSVPPIRLHRIRGEAATPDEAAREYEAELNRYQSDRSGASAPFLDIVLLGMGPDGHTASIFPGSRLLADPNRWVGVERDPALDPHVPRVTLTLDALDRSRFIGFLVAGAEKAPALARALRRPVTSETPPAGLVRGLDATEWFVDHAALVPGRPPAARPP